MASKRQVRDWVVQCLRENLRPDALSVRPSADEETALLVTLRQPETFQTPGQTFILRVEQ